MIGIIKIWSEKFGEAWTACMLCMVQGDVTVLTVSHALTASKTGALTGAGCVLASFVFRTRNKVTDAFMTGIVTSAADIAIHPTHFGPQMAEAALTGVVAAAICYLIRRK
ncbi:MAG: hypothetical protein VW496_01230 [Pelagibacteraceae bacterium]